MTRRLRSGPIPAEALWCEPCGSAITRRLRMRYGASCAEDLWRDACGSAMPRRLRKLADETLR